MTIPYPKKILITGGREVGGVSSFADSLREGFAERGIAVEILPPAQIFRRWRELRDPEVLKILSTTAVFAAPFARRAICVAHGFPCADYQGWLKLLAILASLKLANRSSGAQLVTVSHYVALHLRTIFDLKIDDVIHNPLRSLFTEAADCSISEQREYVTYVGRLIAVKNLHRLLPALRDLLDESPGLRVCIIGDGEMRSHLQELVEGDSRFEFLGVRDPSFIREQLRRTRLFVSGCETEAFGITYLEALTQGCKVAMPASGGGLEIAPEKIGEAVQLLPLSWDRGEVLAILRRGLSRIWSPISTGSFTVEAATTAYLRVGLRFSPCGRIFSSRQ